MTVKKKKKLLLDFAMSYNVQPDLVCIAIGLEPFEKLCDRDSRL
jgi:hypothetical protein